MRNIARHFEQFLASRDLRLTRQRAEILRAIFATHKHVTADELYDMLRRSKGTAGLKISRATVYRTLSLLVEGGFIQALELGTEQGTLYEHVMGHEHHDHMVCLECGTIIEFHDERLEQVQDEAVERHGFGATSHRLIIYGTCASCLAAGKGPAALTDGDPDDDAADAQADG